MTVHDRTRLIGQLAQKRAYETGLAQDQMFFDEFY